MDLIKIKRNYQITLPKNLREKFNLSEGDYLKLEDLGGIITIKPVEVYTKNTEELIQANS